MPAMSPAGVLTSPVWHCRAWLLLLTWPTTQHLYQPNPWNVKLPCVLFHTCCTNSGPTVLSPDDQKSWVFPRDPLLYAPGTTLSSQSDPNRSRILGLWKSYPLGSDIPSRWLAHLPMHELQQLEHTLPPNRVTNSSPKIPRFPRLSPIRVWILWF